MPFDPTTATAFDPSSAAPVASPAGGTQPAQEPEADGALWTALHGAADTGTFGLADKASAGIASLLSGATGKPMTYGEAYSKIKANADRNAQANPTAATLGDIGGMLAGGGGIAKVAGKVAEAVPALARVGEALTAVPGQGVRNVAKAAVSGGAAAAGYTAADEGIRNGTIDPDTVLINAGAGAVASPVIGKVGSLVGKTAVALGDAIANRVPTGLKALPPASQKAIGVLADKIGETPDTLAAAYDNFRAQTGRNPTMSEIVGMKSAGELKMVARNNPTVQGAVNDAADTADSQRPMSLSQIVEDNGGGAQDIRQLTNARKDRMDAAMDPIRNSAVGIDTTDAPLLTDPRTQAAIRATKDPALRDRVNDALDEIRQNGSSDVLSLNDIDSIRKSVRNEQSNFANPQHPRHNVQAAQGHGMLADNLADLGTSSEPAYADALQQFQSDSHYIAGFKHGNAGRSVGEADTPDLINALDQPEGRAGLQAGLTTRTANAAASSPEGAARTATTLAAGGGDTAALRGAVGQPAFDNMQGAAAAENAGKASLDTIRGAPKPTDDSGGAQQAGQAIGALAAHSPSGVLFHLSRAIPGLNKTMPPAVQKKVAQYLTDPALTRQGINLLRAHGARDADIRKFALALGTNAALNTSDTLGH